MHWVDSVVAVGAEKEYAWVFRPLRPVVIGRVSKERREIIRVVGGAILVDPRLSAAEEVVADHVEKRHAAERHAKELRPLRDGRADEQPAVRSAECREPVGAREALLEELLGDRKIVVEDVLLLVAHASAVPLFAVLAAPAQVRDDPDAPAFEPRIDR